MLKRELTQKEFGELLRQATPSRDRCFLPGCKEEPALAIRKGEKEYGICGTHWDMIGRSDVEWSSADH